MNNNGFGGLETLLIVAALLLLAGAGSYVYSKKHGGGGLLFGGDKSTVVTYKGASNTTSPNGIPGGANTPISAAPPVSATNVIKLTSVGFSITVPDSLKGLTWHVTKDGSTSTVTFSTASLMAAAPGCSADQNNGAFDVITRGNGDYPGPANPGSGGLLKQYSDYYLAYTLPNAPCAHNLSPETQNLADAQAQDFYSSLSSVKAL